MRTSFGGGGDGAGIATVGSVLASQLTGVAFQAVYFVVLARGLGASQYGVFIGAAAVTAVLSPFASLGTSQLVVRALVDDPAGARRHLGEALVTVLFASVVVGGGAAAFMWMFLPRDTGARVIAALVVSDCLLLRWTDAIEKALVGCGRPRTAAQLSVVTTGAKAAGAIVLVAFWDTPRISDWAVLYAISSLLTTGWAFWLARSAIGAPSLRIPRDRVALREGALVSLAATAHSLYSDIDKMLLVRLAGVEAAGVYGAASRIITVAFLPVRSLLYSSYAHFFIHGASGVRGGIVFGSRLIRAAVGYGIAAGLVIVATASFVPAILGRDFVGTASILRWLAPLLAIRGAQYVLLDVLSGARQQWARTAVQSAVALLSVALGWWLIGRYSWRGAATSALLSAVLLTAGLWLVLAHLRRREHAVAARSATLEA